MVDLRAKPYCLTDTDIAWVEQTIAAMTDEEKVGQLFFDHSGKASDEQLREMVRKYHLGGYLAMSIVTVPVLGFGIKPLGPRIRPNAPILGITVGIVIITSTSVHPPLIFWM